MQQELFFPLLSDHSKDMILVCLNALYLELGNKNEPHMHRAYLEYFEQLKKLVEENERIKTGSND